MDEQQCETCKFWKKTSEASDKMKAMGRCRRHAPQDGDIRGHTYSWPRTMISSWCGEWQAQST